MSAKPLLFAAGGFMAAALFALVLTASSPSALADRQHAVRQSPPLTTPTPAITPTPTCLAPSQWSVEPTITVPRAYAAGVVANDGQGDKYYVIGGESGELPTRSVERYNPATNTWANMPSMQVPVSHIQSTSIGMRIYVPGGYNPSQGGAQQMMQVYYSDPQYNYWIICPHPPLEAVYGAATASLYSNNDWWVFIIGGTLANETVTNHVWGHRPLDENDYVPKANLPIAESDLAAVALNGLVYVFGGHSHYLSYAYNPATDAWTALAPGLTPNFVSPTAFVLNGQIWVVGGSDDTGQPYPPGQQVHIYDPATNSWSFGPPLNTSRAAASAGGAVNGRGYIAGGLDEAGAFSRSVESVAYAPCITGTPTPTRTATQVPTPTPTDTLPDLMSTSSWATPCPSVLHLATFCTNCHQYPPNVTAGPSHMRIQNSAGDHYDFPVPEFNYYVNYYDYPCQIGSCIPESFFTSYPITLTADIFNEVPEVHEGNNTSGVPQGPPPTPVACATISPTPPTVPPTNTPVATVTPSATPPPSTCDLAWRVVPAPTVDTWHDVVALSAGNAWAVGQHGTIHWDGSGWSQVPTGGIGYFWAAAATAPNDVWAAGGQGIMHWDGGSWSISAPISSSASLLGISADSATDAWAVGADWHGGQANGLTMHWNGTGWSTVPSYCPGSMGCQLWSVDAVSTNDVWVVGGGDSAVAARWDGVQWVDLTPGLQLGCGFASISVLAPDQAWAAGSCGSISLLMRYNGSGWVLESTPDIGPLSSVSATSANDIWAVGAGGILHSDGVTWTQSPAPRAMLFQGGVDGVASDDVWAVGENVILHYSPALFADVPPTNTFYPYVQCLACRGLISGYSDGTFRPYNNITRGQISKVVSNAANFQDDVTGRQTYTDVPPDNTFWLWVERLTLHGVMSGYQCGIDPNEPCDPQNRPYFRWANNATRAQLAKIDSNAAGYSEEPTTQTFADVPPSYTFYAWVERLATRQIMGGYPCGGPGEPCDPQNRPYFRPGNNVTRGQAAKIVANTFYPNCQWR